MAARGEERDEPLVIDGFPGLEGEVGWDIRPISRKGSERVIRFSFELAKRRESRLGSVQKVTCVDKSNVTRDADYSGMFSGRSLLNTKAL